VKQIARELGVRYVLEGSVRKAGNRIRASAQLIEAESGKHLWAERFDRDLSDIFVLEEEITQRVVGALEPEMLQVEGSRTVRKSAAANLDAFDCCMRGLWHFHQFALDNNRQAEAWLRRSIELDPNLAQAHMGLARTLIARIWLNWSSDIEKDLLEADASARRAVALDDRDPYAHYTLFLASMLMRQHEQALAEAQRAIDLSPNFALGYFALGWIRIYIGRSDEAFDPLMRGLRLNPNDPQIGALASWIGLAHYHQKNYEQAIRDTESVRTMLGGLHLAPGSVRVEKDEQIDRSVAPILAVMALPLPRPGRDRLPHLADELCRALVETHHRPLRIGRFGVEVEHVLHAGDKGAIDQRDLSRIAAATRRRGEPSRVRRRSAWRWVPSPTKRSSGEFRPARPRRCSRPSTVHIDPGFIPRHACPADPRASKMAAGCGSQSPGLDACGGEEQL
jgi:tetratricopeptide (TPR) repeat protein